MFCAVVSALAVASACALAGAFACLLLGLDLTPQHGNIKTVRTTRKESRALSLYFLAYLP
jgi:hypothetical protein